MSVQKKSKKTTKSSDDVVKKVKFNKRKGILLAVVLAVIILVVGVYFCFAKLFFVKNVEVVVTQKTVFENPYTDEQLYSGLGIEKGKGLYSFDATTAEKNAGYNLPYFKEVKISRRWPSTVVAKVVLEEPAFYCEIADNLYVVSKDLKVLEYITNARKIKLNSLIYLKTSGIHNCIVGKKIGINDNSEKIILELLAKFSEKGIANNVTSLDVTDEFDIEFMYDTVYLVKLGDIKNLDAKMHYLVKIIEDREGNIGGGVIDLNNVSNKEAKFDKFK